MVSVIISTYNRPDALFSVLNSLNNQTNLSFEAVIADDGSSDDTLQVIRKFQKISNFDILHVWQEDDGFRAAQIRNKAVAKSSGEYLIFLDGDCATFPKFISKHAHLAEKSYFVRGSRIMMSESYTQEFMNSKVRPTSLSFLQLLSLWWRKKIKRIFPLITIPLGKLRKLKQKEWYGVKTCNLGMWRKDFFAVNGFDEQYIGWGHEDADLAIRLINNGVRRKEGVNAVTVLHLWHPLNDRSNLKENKNRLDSRIKSSITRITQGVSQYC